MLLYIIFYRIFLFTLSIACDCTVYNNYNINEKNSSIIVDKSNNPNKLHYSLNSSNFSQISPIEEDNVENIVKFTRLVLEAETIHLKLSNILSDYYFRIFLVNLDSNCKSKPRINSCPSQTHYLSLDKNKTKNGATPFSLLNTPTPNSNKTEVAKCHVDRCNSREVPLSIMGNRKENYVLRFSEGLVGSTDGFGFNRDFLVRSNLVPDNCVFVDLLRNPPSYTGYNGQDDWRLMYDEIDKYDNMSCKESLHFYKLISGMRGAISAFSALNYECTNAYEAYEDQTELPSYQSNYHYYNNKLSKHKDRLENIYYTYKYILSAVVRLKGYLDNFNSNLQLVNNDLYLHLKDFLTFINKSNITTDSNGSNHNNLQTECGKEMVEKFDRLIELVNCVECEKCKLHGKLKLSAIQTSIKILMTDVDKLGELDLNRNDLVALFHGLDYFAQSILIIERFEQHKKRRIMLYPLRFLLGCLLAIVVIYKQEILSLPIFKL
ncbi:Endoplasmic Reticulum Oxidoreductin 1 (ERO1) family protein [Theileria parva strain Muguga]|uniref:Endoplasmic reticulum oxidoreductin n=1 Tax=Theileria parva TaxID=5875 RepID=Q4MZU9_THEPA|nr:Endoplasmic Reticulum Oxidoreductin 1 (ERO1) family protein [Theileria parva strain Muguga]EAN31148.1 Endoplasmic Reticulum Oxidoreductin 1 (ERO1) family protein [Theileria parva strain Muguga]|eukprot:XP_763431.1 hypothetical protein [Theileria parva strain Muguga]